MSLRAEGEGVERASVGQTAHQPGAHHHAAHRDIIPGHPGQRAEQPEQHPQRGGHQHDLRADRRARPQAGHHHLEPGRIRLLTAAEHRIAAEDGVGTDLGGIWSCVGGRVVRALIVRDFEDQGLAGKEAMLEAIVRDVMESYPGSAYTFTVTEQYRNMKVVLDRYPQVVEYAQEAVRRADMEPKMGLVRGGTDGSRLSFMGLPCPNIFAGEHAYRAVIPIADTFGLVGDGNLRMYLGHGTKIYLLPLLHRNEVSYDVTCLATDSTPAPQGSKEQLLRVVGGFDDRLVKITEGLDMEKVNLRAVYDIDPVDSWHSGSVVLIGDAAHLGLFHQDQLGIPVLPPGENVGAAADGGRGPFGVSGSSWRIWPQLPSSAMRRRTSSWVRTSPFWAASTTFSCCSISRSASGRLVLSVATAARATRPAAAGRRRRTPPRVRTPGPRSSPS